MTMKKKIESRMDEHKLVKIGFSNLKSYINEGNTVDETTPMVFITTEKK